jgi:hypothetical protein
MLKDIVAAKALGGYRLHLRFEDGAEGVVDLAPQLSFRGVFEPLRDPAYFAQVRVDPELGTVAWPNGADLDPDVLYGRVTGTPILAGARHPFGTLAARLDLQRGRRSCSGASRPWQMCRGPKT